MARREATEKRKLTASTAKARPVPCTPEPLPELPPKSRRKSRFENGDELRGEFIPLSPSR
jgi:hypothetical protein